MNVWRGIMVWLWISIGFALGFVYTDSLANQRAVEIAQEFLKEHAEEMPTCRPPPLPPSQAEKWDPFHWGGSGKTQL